MLCNLYCKWKIANLSRPGDSDFLVINHSAIHVLQAPSEKVDWPERGVNLASCRESQRFPYLLLFILLVRRTGCVSRDKISGLFLWRDRVAGGRGTECIEAHRQRANLACVLSCCKQCQRRRLRRRRRRRRPEPPRFSIKGFCSIFQLATISSTELINLLRTK